MGQLIEMHTEPQVVFFELSPGFAEKISNSPIPFATHASYSDFTSQGSGPLCFVVGSHDARQAENLAKSLRSDPGASLTPIFLLKSLGDPADMLFDGVVSSFTEAVEKASPILKHLQELDPDTLIGPESNTYRLLAMLFSRDAELLVPYRHWRTESYYHYPVVDAMIGEGDSTALLEGIIERQLIKPSRLIDRLRHCPKCSGSHLNYIDVCPQCEGIDITNKPFLHCFACGYVAPEDTFFSQGALVCPKCTARLRHIGTDYDRPLENFQCNECDHVFIEPSVSCRCMHCGIRSDPEALVPRPVYAYQLTERGRISATTGSIEDVFSLFDSLNNVNSVVFESILDWLLSLCRRHSEEQFSLIAIRMKNIMELTDRLGRYEMKKIIDEFARRVRELIRSTDLTTRTNQNTLWLLLPKTHREGNQIVLERILEIRTDDEIGLDLATTSYHAPSQTITTETAKLLMARMQSEILE